MQDHPISFHKVAFSYNEEDHHIFEDLNVQLPAGVTSLMGQNGTGKTTFLLLAAGRVLPTTGSVLLQGKDTAILSDEEKNRLCSLVFQNMEFETDDSLGDLLEFVFGNGSLQTKDGEFLKQVVKVFELDQLLTKKTQTLAKGQMQRAVMAFALLYGSQITAMDEPVFALEDAQKHRALEYISSYSKASGRSFLFSAHDMDLTRKYSQNVLLFFKNRSPVLGTTETMFDRDLIEEAYQVPFALLHQKEQLYREILMNRPTPREVWEKTQGKV